MNCTISLSLSLMGDTFRFTVGIMGNAASLLLYSTPILTFRRILRKKSTEEFTCVPYIIALLNCLLYTWYGSPAISRKWENLPVVTINGMGVVLEFSFILIYAWFAPTREKKKVCLITVPVIMFFCIIVFVSIFALHSQHQRKIVVGTSGLFASIAMYGSPLVVMRQVMKTKSVEFMPFYLSLFSFLASSLWMLYGLLSRDLFLTSPNLVGCPLGVFQLLLYCIYRRKEIKEEPQVKELEKNQENLKVQI